MDVMNSFGAAAADKRFTQAFPYVEDSVVELKRYYELAKLEAENLPRRQREAQLQKLDDEYVASVSDLASRVLENDLDYRMSTSSQIALTPKLKRSIKAYKNRLLRRGVIEVVKSKPICVVCGKTAESGDLFVVMDKDNSAACLDCCTCDTKLNKLANLVFID